jgi:hypothetical protein
MRTWRILNPPLHHQNRLRRPDYLEAFATAGFHIVEERVTEPSERDLAALRAIRLSPAFQSYSLRELAVKAMRVIAKPAR